MVHDRSVLEMDAILVYFCGLHTLWKFYLKMQYFAVSMLLRFTNRFSICVSFCFTAEVQRSMLASMLGFMKKTKHIRNNELDGSIYLSQLDADGLDPEIARLYLSHCDCTDSYKPEGKIFKFFFVVFFGTRIELMLVDGNFLTMPFGLW